MANEAANANIVPARVSRTMKDFEEKTPRQSTTADPIIGRTLRSSEELEFLKSDENGSDAAAIAYTCIGLCNDPETPEEQACAYFLSALTTTIPSLEAVAVSTLQAMGYSVLVLSQGAIAGANINLADPPQAGKILVMISQLIFLLYKNVSEVSYTRFMTNRTSAIKALVMPGGGPTEVVISLSRAKVFRQTLGAQFTLRRTVLTSMLNLQHNNTPAARMYAYICGILCWTEMSAIMFVYQSLCLTKSPVLKQLVVRDELKNLDSAFKEIIEEETPQYYRILHPYHENRKIEKSKFPILAAVAQELRRERHGTVSQFAGSRDVDMTVVNELVSMHHAYMGIQPEPAPNKYLDFLYGADGTKAEDEAHTDAGGGGGPEICAPNRNECDERCSFLPFCF